MWISGSGTKNYFCKDLICEFFKRDLTNAKSISNSGKYDFTTFMMKKGQLFEEKVNEYLKRKFKNEYINIGGSHGNSYPTGIESCNMYINTIEAIRNGIPIISSGVVRNYFNNTYGVPDLIIKVGYLKKLLKNHLSLEGLEDHLYVVVDIKYTTLNLSSDGVHLINSGIISAYKSQVYIYSRAVANMQSKVNIANGFLLGRKWSYEKYEDGVRKKYQGDNCFDRVGKIDFLNRDIGTIEKTNKAINIIRDIHDSSKNCKIEDYPPNMKNEYDYPFHQLKIEKIFKGEITQVWNCSEKERKIYFNKHLRYPEYDNCSSKELEIKGKTGEILDEIFYINSKNNNCKIKNVPKNNPLKDKFKFYIDFETINDSVLTEFENFPIADKESYIFQIGIGYFDPILQIFLYKSFIVDRINKEEELRICNELLNYINEVITKFKIEDYRIVHWSVAEPSYWKKVSENLSNLQSKFYDLLPFFKSNMIVVRGALDYSLKSIAKAMYKLEYIKTSWEIDNEENKNSKCLDGKMAMIGAYLANKDVIASEEADLANTKLDGKIKNLGESLDAIEIIKYNEVDCKVLYEILNFLEVNYFKN
jgi:hypothetical protein